MNIDLLLPIIIVLVIIGFIFVSYSIPYYRSYEQSQINISTSPRGSGVGWVEAIVVVDNNPNPSSSSLLTAWGLSIYIRIPAVETLCYTL
ncbi:hypothetical protein Igag_0659 [Ignisphaera aggregans DSM 17230]|uniref:Uncharacterized protein n=1 Tax=Ignisphaera aggregans (strain DSM 17230 / JCM 13409 / AQ1.S1) TaxID=583356 RepID=E0SSU1_IGNAA|nr:hypothetical protein Igag_0659 [Ignisphaera aggregans DSM 17230]